jgi:hypothetical protein
MDLDDLDRHIVIKCKKVKRGVRTNVYYLYKYFDDINDCYKICNKLKKKIGTSMVYEPEPEPEFEEDDKQQLQNSSDEHIESKKKKGKKSKKSRKNTTKTLCNYPIFSFGGNQVDILYKFFIDSGVIPEDEIKL